MPLSSPIRDPSVPDPSPSRAYQRGAYTNRKGASTRRAVGDRVPATGLQTSTVTGSFSSPPARSFFSAGCRAERTGYASYQRGFPAELDVTWRRIYDRHQDTIKVRRIGAALANLEKIVSATLRISNRSSFHSMSLRDLSREADISMGARYSCIESKDRLSPMILGHVLFLVHTVLTSPSDPASSSGRPPVPSGWSTRS